MKKRLLVFSVIMSVTVLLQAEGYKYYSDTKNGYSGSAMAFYVGTTKDINPSDYLVGYERFLREKGYNIVGYCTKLSKQEDFLFWAALNEYKCAAKEVYSVSIKIEGENRILNVAAVVKKPGKTCDQYGGFYWIEPASTSGNSNNSRPTDMYKNPYGNPYSYDDTLLDHYLYDDVLGNPYGYSTYGNSASSPSRIKEHKICSSCNGTGYLRYDYIEAPAYDGIASKSYCDICKSIVNSHTHKRCYICNGSGYIDY